MAAVTIGCSMVIVSPIMHDPKVFFYIIVSKGCFKNLPVNCFFLVADHYRRGLPGAYKASALKLYIQPVPVCSLQGGWHLSVWGSGQHVSD